MEIDELFAEARDASTSEEIQAAYMIAASNLAIAESNENIARSNKAIAMAM